ncbi:VOC family protein [Marinicella litoralis]|uniref:Catechol 2,3-dioxygenase-like lactoylglutathione lyase family enzyme n=1 Tax=Marinicella litoralis TaxID=644220 RepID=A0A4R6XGD7_9GAMM|nr:VOC family protein [Marinicella litoralis]TDR18465.1 catechol 2,3-dioxygenase-like lactoylglutathione lyase family enzyme [Marinicella litoralis]
MIHIEHINLIVKDMTATIKFYQTALPHWFIRGKGSGDWYGHPRNWVHFGDEYQYITFNDNGTGENRDLTGHDLGLAHFGLVCNDVKSIIDRLNQAGYAERVAYSCDEYRANVYFIDPNGFEVEFVQYMSDQPKQRNQYD